MRRVPFAGLRRSPPPRTVIELTMLRLAFRNLFRRPVRLALATLGVALGVAVWLTLMGLGDGYRHGLQTELNRAGVQLMLVPLGCPYDAAARVLKGRTLENSLPASALAAVQSDPAVAVAAPLLIAAVPRPSEKRTDLWVGLDEAGLALRPWWKAEAGSRWFQSSNGVILGAEAAQIELRAPGDGLHSPELERTFRVEGVLERSGTSDDSLFFLPLSTAQRLFSQEARLTAVAIRLHDPAQLRAAVQRLQDIPGAQVVTMTEMMGTFLRLLGTVRTLLSALAIVACAVAVLGVLNTLLAAVVERTPELCLLRAVGASRWQVMGLMTLESCLLVALGTALGMALALVGGPVLEECVKPFLPMAPAGSLMQLSSARVIECIVASVVGALLVALYPAWRAGRIPPALAAKSE